MEFTVYWRQFTGSVILIAALWALNIFTIQPLACNRERRVLRTRATTNFNRSDLSAVRQQARRDSMRALHCAKSMPSEVDFFLIAAANFRITGQLESAARMYRRALDREPRPEIYINYGEVLLQSNHRDEGLDALTTAARFYGDPGYVDYMLRNVAERQIVIERLGALNR